MIKFPSKVSRCDDRASLPGALRSLSIVAIRTDRSIIIQLPEGDERANDEPTTSPLHRAGFDRGERKDAAFRERIKAAKRLSPRYDRIPARPTTRFRADPCVVLADDAAPSARAPSRAASRRAKANRKISWRHVRDSEYFGSFVQEISRAPGPYVRPRARD